MEMLYSLFLQYFNIDGNAKRIMFLSMNFFILLILYKYV